MKKTLLSLTLIAAFTLAACGKDDAPAKNTTASQTFVQPVENKTNDGTVGMLLPNFAELVAREGSTVVNIQAASEKDNTSMSNNDDLADNDPFSEFFKRLIPNQPDFPQSENEANFGSGVIISEDGYVMTNAHVIKGMNNIKVTLNDKREYPAKLVGSDEKSDIALLKIDAQNLPAAKIGNPDELKSGEWVAAIGAPFGFDNSVTAGIVSAKNRTLPDETYTPFIQTDVAINPGNSGGPLFNLKGQVVGINSQIYSRSGGFMGISFAIPIDVAMNVADQLKATGKVQRGQLGVIIQEVSYDLAKTFGLDKPTGALIAKVISGSPAEKASLRVGDIIRSVNDNEVRSSSDLPMTIGALAPGKEVKLGVWRKGNMTEITVTLGEQGSQTALNLDNKATRPYSGSVDGFEFAAAGLTISVENGVDNSVLLVRKAQGISANAGLRRGDIIVEIAGQAVHNKAEFESAIGQSGKNIPVLINRGGNMIFLALILP
ncbi:DegQ family serine endoprotease [Wielerella bovis]|uniref:DegQ family serine endoprotease n=1 Tax=Wielerella bovis TaxID=2917790 RepID=UPI002018F914|nr:DegQ family serine endoprotease [Wielerella bovis]MCG7657755.1 DegQ family serine endoprotease [Wielerella bovis]MCG7659976.1 DegQ family serine endoprotease [Wielerella bovis]